MTARIGTAVHLTDAPVGSEGWAAARRTRINGSEIAAVMGLSPYESPFSLWHRKAGHLVDVDETDPMRWGTLLEPVVRDEWNRRRLLDGVTASETGQWCHVDRPWQGGSPDGLVYPLIVETEEAAPEALLEVKTSRHGDGFGEPGTDEIPIHYRCQVLWYLDVFGLQVCHLAVLVAGSDYREYTVRLDPAEVEPMRLKARAFLDTLDAGQAPDIDGHSATYEAVREMHPDIELVAVDTPDHVARPYLEALIAEKDARAEKRRTTSLLLEHMGSARDAYWNGERIASRQAKGLDGIPYLTAAKGAADQHRSSAA